MEHAGAGSRSKESTHTQYAEYQRQLPDDSILFPRDRRKLSETRDMLFYAMLLTNLSPDMKSIDICKRILPTGARFEHLLRDRAGILFTPVARCIAANSDDLRLVRRMKITVARRGFINGFFDFRSVLRSMVRHLHPYAPPERPKTASQLFRNAFQIMPGDYSHFRIGDLLLVDHANINEEALDRINRAMRWPVQAEEDPILDHPDTRPMFEAKVFCDLPPEHFDVICPLDGYVALISARFISPRWTWVGGREREFNSFLCPQCLARFGGEL